MKPILYISGPYSADSLIDRQQNILNAKRRYVAALATGEWWAVCPHTHTAEMEMHLPGVDHDEWLRMDITMLAGCDAIWVDDCHLSKGARMELVWAWMAKIPIYIGPESELPAHPLDILHSPWICNEYLGITMDTDIDMKKEYKPIVTVINDMVSRGEIPDPKTYKGSVLTRGKNESD